MAGQNLVNIIYLEKKIVYCKYVLIRDVYNSYIIIFFFCSCNNTKVNADTDELTSLIKNLVNMRETFFKRNTMNHNLQCKQSFRQHVRRCVPVKNVNLPLRYSKSLSVNQTKYNETNQNICFRTSHNRPSKSTIIQSVSVKNKKTKYIIVAIVYKKILNLFRASVAEPKMSMFIHTLHILRTDY